MKDKNSVFLICLNEDFGNAVAKQLANRIDKNFIDCKEQISQELFIQPVDKGNANIHFLEEQECLCLKKISNLENSIIFLNYNLFIRNKNIFKGLKLVYLSLPENQLAENDVLSKIDFAHRDKILKSVASKIIELDSIDFDKTINMLLQGD